MQSIISFFKIHYAEADYKLLFGNLLIIIGVCTILFFAFIDTPEESQSNDRVSNENVSSVAKSEPVKVATPAASTPKNGKKGRESTVFVKKVFSPLKRLVFISCISEC
jgi:hypothetical protein